MKHDVKIRLTLRECPEGRDACGFCILSPFSCKIDLCQPKGLEGDYYVHDFEFLPEERQGE